MNGAARRYDVPDMTGDLEQILGALSSAGTRYLVVGGVAVVLHGHLRVTADLDLVIELEADNIRRALEALGSLGFTPTIPVSLTDFADPALRSKWITEKGMQVFSVWSDRFRATQVDLFVQEPFSFSEAWLRSLVAPIGGAEVRVASIPDLIALKETAGRPRDLEDIEALRRIEEARGSGD